MTDNVAVFGVVKATIADIKPGAFVGVGAMPQPDGSQKAIRVMIFAESQRGTGEGHRPWMQPGSTMTNATRRHHGGERGRPDADGEVQGRREEDHRPAAVSIIQQYVVGDKSELKPGAAILITAATKKPDGTLETARVNVGRGGVVPQ